MASIELRLATSSDDLRAILALQRRNLKGRVPDEEATSQGFVTVEHTLEILERMQAQLPHVVATMDGQLAGYALSMHRACRDFLPVLVPMFAQLDSLEWRGAPLRELRTYVMGQICIDRPARGRGLFDALYAEHRRRFGERFDAIVTEISARNGRSLAAHARVGFEVAHRYRDETDEWVVVIWDWR